MAVGPSSPTTARVSDLLRYPSKVAPVMARSWWSPVRSRAPRVNCSASQAARRPVRVWPCAASMRCTREARARAWSQRLTAVTRSVRGGTASR